MSTKNQSVTISHPPHSSRNSSSPCHHQAFLRVSFKWRWRLSFEKYLEERFDDSSKPTKARAAVKWIAFWSGKGNVAGGSCRLIPPRKAKRIVAIEHRAGRHQAVFSFCKKGYVRVCQVLIAGSCSSRNTHGYERNKSLLWARIVVRHTPKKSLSI